jgi:inorganic triphosphatase YgiF
MSDLVEVELKLEYEPADRERLIAAIQPEPVGSKPRRLVATYFDTPDLALSKAGYSLRVRREGSKRVQTVKTVSSNTAGLFSRGEWDRPVAKDEPVLDDKAGPLGQIVDAHVRARITSIFVTDVERLAGPVESATAQLEYAIDSGEVRTGQRSVPLSELELELKQGSPELLFDFARNLNEKVPLRLGVKTKSSRGYALIGAVPGAAVKAEPIRLDPELTAAQSFVEIAGACIRQYRLNEALLLESGGVEAIHQARVALRRLRSAFALFRPMIQGDDRAPLLSAELRWLAGELGLIRDIDVLLPRLGQDQRTALAVIRDGKYEHLHNLLLSSQVRLLPIDLSEWLTIGQWQTRPADPALHDRNIREFAADRLDRLRRRIKHEGRHLATVDDEHRHEVRKDAKKLRYAAEFFVSLYPGRKARHRIDAFLDRLEDLQDKLGQLNDIAAAPELLARLGLDAEVPAPGEKERQHLIRDAADCFDALMGVKRFWRT